jgi:hypothetical protein
MITSQIGDREAAALEPFPERRERPQPITNRRSRISKLGQTRRKRIEL